MVERKWWTEHTEFTDSPRRHGGNEDARRVGRVAGLWPASRAERTTGIETRRSKEGPCFDPRSALDTARAKRGATDRRMRQTATSLSVRHRALRVSVVNP